MWVFGERDAVVLNTMLMQYLKYLAYAKSVLLSLNLFAHCNDVQNTFFCCQFHFMNPTRVLKKIGREFYPNTTSKNVLLCVKITKTSFETLELF